MNLKKISILFAIGVLMFGCSRDDERVEAPSNAQEINVSGDIQGGYRILPLKITGEPANLTVYRGDYIKFLLDDEGATEENYLLEITDLGISSNIAENIEEQAFFKMKTVGVYPFAIGERAGVINVVEFRQANYAELSNQEAFDLLSDNPPLLLDVRTQGEFNRGFIEGGVLIPLQEIQYRIGELEKYKNQTILIYCATGNRSTTASKILLDQGFKDIMNLRSGIVGWARNGYAIQFP